MKSNIKSKEGSKILSLSKGFTIIELLVVIVVIGILAAISVVSYSGISSKAKTSANQANAQSVAAGLDAVFTEKSLSAYPAWDTNSATTLGKINAGSAKVSSSIVLQNSAVSSETTNIGYVVVGGGTGVCLSYWNHTGTAAANYIGVGSATLTYTSGVATSCS